MLDETQPPPTEQRAPWEEPERRADPNERTVTGKVGNPRFSRPKGKGLWKAGIGVSDTNGQLHWVNVTAFDRVAESADQFAKGDMVTITGKPHVNRYVDANGIAQERDEFIISSIDWAA